MAQATGKLMWGQAGEYDAIDDRQVISSTTQGAPGVLMPPSLAAGPGLTILVGPFVAAVPCDDGTVAIAHSGDQLSITAPAGPTSGSALYSLFLEANPDDGTWGLDLIDRTQVPGLLGIGLAGITIPQGANLATQFTMWPSINQLGFVRSFLTPADRRDFYQSLDSRPWGPGFGNLTAVTNDPTWGYHLDITNPNGRTCEMLWNVGARVAQGGFVSVVTGPFGGAGTNTFPIPYTQTPHVVATSTTFRPGIILIGEGGAGVNTTSWSGQFVNFDGTPVGNTTVHYYWVAVGRVVTDTIPTT